MKMSYPPQLHFDRRAPEPLLAALSPGGELHTLVELAVSPEGAASALDLQLRADPRRELEGHATLYVGLTKALDLELGHDGRFRVVPQSQFGPATAWEVLPSWTGFLSLDELAAVWPDVMAYARATIDVADSRYTRSEGGMQAVLSNADSDDFAVIDREAVIGFDPRSKEAFLAPIKDALSGLTADLTAHGEGWARERTFGDELDALAIDSDGRVLVMEVKPGVETTAVGWTPAQVTLYHWLFSAWAEQQPETAPDVLEGMLQQRVRVGLERRREWRLRTPLELVPMIAVGGEVRNRKVANDRMLAVWAAIGRSGLSVVEPTVWQVATDGRVTSRPLGQLAKTTSESRTG